MATAEALDLKGLYEEDETAWLEAMSALAAGRRYSEMDFPHLSEYLADMARRDRREVFSRLVGLLSHLLQGECQPHQVSGSWRGTLREQRRELRQLLASRTLRNHAQEVLPEAYAEARRQAAEAMALGSGVFPPENSRSLDELLAEPGGSPAFTSREEWIKAIREWAESHQAANTWADWSRESVYTGRGE